MGFPPGKLSDIRAPYQGTFCDVHYLSIIVAIIGLMLTLSIVWATVRWGISPMPSSNQARRTMLDMVPNSDAFHIIELGSGWGHLAFAVRTRFPQARITGYEASLFPWLWSAICTRWKRNEVEFKKGDFFEADLSNADVVLTYLYTGAMQKIAEHQASLTPGTILISNTFRVPGWTPDEVVELDDLYRTRIYRYTVPAGVENAPKTRG